MWQINNGIAHAEILFNLKLEQSITFTPISRNDYRRNMKHVLCSRIRKQSVNQWNERPLHPQKWGKNLNEQVETDGNAELEVLVKLREKVEKEGQDLWKSDSWILH